MADNVIASAAVGVGATFATDEVGGAHYPYSKIAFGPDGTATIVSTSNGLPVSVINTSVAVTDNGGSLTVDGTVAATQSGTWNVGTVTAVTSITNPVAVTDNSGSLTVDDGGGSLTVDGTVAATQSGAWSSRLQDGSGNAVTSRVTGSSRPLEIAVVDASGNQITSFGGSGGTASNFTSAVPSTGTAVGYSDGTNMQAARVFDVDSGAGTQYVQGVNLRIASSGGSVEGGTSSNPIRTDPTGTTTQPVSDGGGSLTVDGTVAATQSGTWNVGTVTTLTSVTNPVAVTDNSGSLTVDDGGSSLTVDGTVAATQSGSWTVTANAGTGTLTTTNSSIGTGGSAAPTAATQIGAKVSTNMQVLTGTNTAPGFYALHCDVRAFGGTIGQTIASLSMPVAIASDQSVIPTSQDSATLYAGTTALTPKFAVISASSSGDTSVIAAVTSKKIRVIRYSLSANGNVSAYFRSGAGGTAISGVKYMTQYGGAGGTYCPQGIFETGSNTALVINLNGAIAVSGEITYLEV